MTKIIPIPSTKELASLAYENNFSLTSEESRVFKHHFGSFLSSYVRIEELARDSETEPIRKLTGHAPSKKENPFDAWAWKCSLRLRRNLKSKKLRGKRIAIKDNVLVAGVPLRNGSLLMNGFVPSVDATIVTRILENGGEIAGKSTCEDLCVSGGSHTSYPRPVKNPHNPKYMAGGSSSGSAALVAAREVDMAVGGDQGGSIRIPASLCGVYGLKPTFGLVPFTGVLGMEPFLDHVGPMANNIEDLALLLEVISGRDGHDPRQLNTPYESPTYSKEIRKSIKERLKIAIINEGFGWDGVSESDVDCTIKESAYQFQSLGAKVSEVSIPMHRDAICI